MLNFPHVGDFTDYISPLDWEFYIDTPLILFTAKKKKKIITKKNLINL